jgi:hypothetical protein
MIATAREFLRRILPPQGYGHARSYWWHTSFYFPRLVASAVVRRTPRIHDLAGPHASNPLSNQILGINVFAPTPMCRVMTRHGSDKGKGVHNYTTIYSVLLREFRHQPILIFELGLGTNNPTLLSSMGVNGRPGASLRGWRELFPHALVCGGDIDRNILFDEERIQTFYCDQLDPIAIRDLWSQDVFRGGVDIIIDDGLHTFEGNTSFLNGSLEHLRPGGLYVIEDIRQDAIATWYDYLAANSSKYVSYHIALVTLPTSINTEDNTMLIIRKLR